MPHTNLELVQALYAAFASGNGAAALALMDADIVWNEAENFPYADRNFYIGPAAVAEGVFSRLANEWHDFQAIPDEFLDAGGSVVALGH